MLYFFKVKFTDSSISSICSVFHFADINPFKLSVKINRSVDCIKIENLSPLSLLQ